MTTTSAKLVQALLVSGMLLTGSATAAEQSGVPTDAQRFKAMIGKWKGEGTISGGEQPMKIALSYRCDAAAAGWGIACVLNGKGEGMEMIESDLMGVDPVTGNGHWFAVTNMGETHDHVLTWTDDKNFKAHYAWEQDGARMEENISVSINGRSMEFRSVVSANGQDVGSFVGTLKR